MLFAAVPGWLKSLRLHKYMGVFSQLSYEEMLSLTDDDLVRLGVSAMVREIRIPIGPTLNPLRLCLYTATLVLCLGTRYDADVSHDCREQGGRFWCPCQNLRILKGT
jgi:hypothetical protein